MAAFVFRVIFSCTGRFKLQLLNNGVLLLYIQLLLEQSVSTNEKAARNVHISAVHVIGFSEEQTVEQTNIILKNLWFYASNTQCIG